MSEDEFRRLTARALDNYGDLGRLLRSPLIDLPTVDRRLHRARAPRSRWPGPPSCARCCGRAWPG